MVADTVVRTFRNEVPVTDYNPRKPVHDGPVVKHRNTPVHLEHVRALRNLLPPGENEELRRIEFKSGDILVDQDTLPKDGGIAFFVEQGVLQEQQSRIVRYKGRVTETRFEIAPGQIAFSQALVSPYDKLPALTRVVAASDGTAILLTMDDLRISEQEQTLLMNEFRVRLSLLQSSWRDDRVQEVLTELEPISQHFEAEGTPKSGRDILRELALGLQEARQLRERLEQFTLVNAQLEAEKSAIEATARETRQEMSGWFSQMEQEREQFTLGALGLEFYMARLRIVLRGTISPNELDLLMEEQMLFLGETPPNLAEMRARIEADRTEYLLPNLGDDDLDNALSFAHDEGMASLAASSLPALELDMEELAADDVTVIGD